MDRRFDEIGNVVYDLKLNSRRQLRTQLLHFLSYVVRHANSIHARLPKHLDGDHILSWLELAEQRRPSAQFLRPVFHLRNVSHAHWCSSARANHDFAELFRGGHATERAQPQLLRARDHAPARGLDVFPLQGFAHVQHGEIVRGQLLCIEEYADLPPLPAIEVHTSYAVYGLNRAAHLFVGDFR